MGTSGLHGFIVGEISIDKAPHITTEGDVETPALLNHPAMEGLLEVDRNCFCFRALHAAFAALLKVIVESMESVNGLFAIFFQGVKTPARWAKKLRNGTLGRE